MRGGYRSLGTSAYVQPSRAHLSSFHLFMGLLSKTWNVEGNRKKPIKNLAMAVLGYLPRPTETHYSIYTLLLSQAVGFSQRHRLSPAAPPPPRAARRGPAHFARRRSIRPLYTVLRTFRSHTITAHTPDCTEPQPASGANHRTVIRSEHHQSSHPISLVRYRIGPAAMTVRSLT